MKPIAIIQHVADDGPSYFAAFLEQAGLPFQLFRMFDGNCLPEQIGAYSGLCILGGPMSANDPLPYFPQLFDQVRQCVADDIPLIGHCLGGQIISKAMGGRISSAEQVEIGWSKLTIRAGQDRRWLDGASNARLFQWHGEQFSIPPAANWLMQGDYCAHQAFTIGHLHLAMQFHCEVDEAKVRQWLIQGHDELINSGSPAVQQAADILPTLTHDIAQSQQTAAAIYREWIKGLRRD